MFDFQMALKSINEGQQGTLSKKSKHASDNWDYKVEKEDEKNDIVVSEENTTSLGDGKQEVEEEECSHGESKKENVISEPSHEQKIYAETSDPVKSNVSKEKVLNVDATTANDSQVVAAPIKTEELVTEDQNSVDEKNEKIHDEAMQTESQSLDTNEKARKSNKVNEDGDGKDVRMDESGDCNKNVYEDKSTLPIGTENECHQSPSPNFEEAGDDSDTDLCDEEMTKKAMSVEKEAALKDEDSNDPEVSVKDDSKSDCPIESTQSSNKEDDLLKNNSVTSEIEKDRDEAQEKEKLPGDSNETEPKRPSSRERITNVFDDIDILLGSPDVDEKERPLTAFTSFSDLTSTSSSTVTSSTDKKDECAEAKETESLTENGTLEECDSEEKKNLP